MKYELMYIIPATMTDEEVKTAKDEVTALVAKHGEKTLRDDLLGKRKLAYPIKHIRYGHYVLVCFEANTDAIIHLDEELRHENKVIRHQIVKALPNAEKAEVDLIEYQIPDVYKRRTPKPKKPAAKPANAQKPVSEYDPKISEEQLEEQLDKILDTDTDKL